MVHLEFNISNSITGKCYSISEGESNSKVHIANEDGEGGEFNIDELFDTIDKFFKDRF